jgi:hypothetical protein
MSVLFATSLSPNATSTALQTLLTSAKPGQTKSPRFEKHMQQRLLLRKYKNNEENIRKEFVGIPLYSNWATHCLPFNAASMLWYSFRYPRDPAPMRLAANLCRIEEQSTAINKSQALALKSNQQVASNRRYLLPARSTGAK